MKVDSHQHFWQFNPSDYSWIDDSMRVLQADFMPQDLWPEMNKVGVDSAVPVQARQTLEETSWLLALADEYDFLKGVVGWAPLADSNVRQILEGLANRQKLKGVRHVVQDEPDDDFILRADFNAGVGLLIEYGLAYDILIFERHLPQTIEFVDRHPSQVFILDHLAKPKAKVNEMEPWRTSIRRLAQRDNVYCKISGLVTEANWRAWNEEQLSIYLETVLDAFGPRRLMFGSDWPVCLVASSYKKWYEVVSRFCDKLSRDEQARIFGGTAIEAYRL